MSLRLGMIQTFLRLKLLNPARVAGDQNPVQRKCKAPANQTGALQIDYQADLTAIFRQRPRLQLEVWPQNLSRVRREFYLQFQKQHGCFRARTP